MSDLDALLFDLYELQRRMGYLPADVKREEALALAERLNAAPLDVRAGVFRRSAFDVESIADADIEDVRFSVDEDDEVQCEITWLDRQTNRLPR